MVRKVNPPQRTFDKPLLAAIRDGGENFNYNVSVTHDPAEGFFRMWHSVHAPDVKGWPGKTAYRQSKDGIHWPGPSRALHPMSSHVIDDRHAAVPAERFKAASFRDRDDRWPTRSMDVRFSADGVQFAPTSRRSRSCRATTTSGTSTTTRC